jgi:hypothetical protein
MRERRLRRSLIAHELTAYAFWRVIVKKDLLETDLTPTSPPPSAQTPSGGAEEGRALARQYLPDAIRFLAALAFGKDSEAPLHTRALCARQIIEVAGVIPQAVPTAPPQEVAGNGA